MKKLIKGILDFRHKLLPIYKEKYAHLALSQSPDTLFVACSDSRVVPNLFASTNPGDLFVVRNVGNIIPSYGVVSEHPMSEAAAIEFAFSCLPIDDIVICGHSECGAMKAYLPGVDKIGCPHLRGWLENCECPRDGIKKNHPLSPHNQLSQMNVLQQMKHLLTYPTIQQRVEEGKLNIHGWYFDIATGDVYGYEEPLKKFVVIDEEEAKRILKRLK